MESRKRDKVSVMTTAVTEKKCKMDVNTVKEKASVHVENDTTGASSTIRNKSMNVSVQPSYHVLFSYLLFMPGSLSVSLFRSLSSRVRATA